MKKIIVTLVLCCLVMSQWIIISSVRNTKAKPPREGPISAYSQAATRQHETPSAVVPPKATPEQLASVVRVRASFGGLPPRDTIAALLHRDEIPDKSLVEGFCRFVIAPLKGFKASQLQNPQARILVYRNKTNQNGEETTIAYQGTVMQFDPETGIALLAYLENFESASDAGFHLERDKTKPEKALLLRSFRDPANPLPAPNTLRNPSKPYGVDVGSFTKTKDNTSSIKLPTLAPSETSDPVQLIVDSSDRLVGFVDTSENSPIVTELGKFAVAIRRPAPVITNVSFDTRSNSYITVDLILKEDERDDSAKRVVLLYREVSADEMGDLVKPGPDGSFASISETKKELSARNHAWSCDLPAPTVDVQKLYLMQVAMPMLRQTPGAKVVWPPSAPAVYSQPFLARLTRDAKGLRIFPDLEPLAPELGANTDTEMGAPKSPERFSLEAPAKGVHMIAGGREALIELEGAPYWKRFSFNTKGWLPIPGDLKNASVTGNLNALFIMERGAREVRKFDLSDLSPKGSIQLPPSGGYRVVLAGCNSAHAPVHVIAPDDTLAFNPETMERLDDPSPGNRPPSNEPKELTYSITGDGYSIRRVHNPYDLNFIQYNDDTHGLEYRYFGPIGQPLVGNQQFGGHPGVSGGFDARMGLATRDTVGGVVQNLGRTFAPWSDAYSALAENSPVIFRLQQPGKSGSKLGTPRIGFFAYSSEIPFAELDAPELDQAITEDAWKIQPWIFFDPYSLQVATLSADRRTWYVRELKIDGTRDQPILLNWPDTTIAREGEFQFKPLIAGGSNFKVDPCPESEKTFIDSTEGNITFPVAKNEFGSLKLLSLRIPGKNGTELSYPILVHIKGPQLPFVSSVTTSADYLNSFQAGLSSLGFPSDDFLTLPATVHHFQYPIKEVQGPVANCAVLIAEDRVDFFSLQTRRVIGSRARAPGTAFYPAAGGLLEYDPGKRTLTRIAVPSGIHEQQFSFPPYTRLCALGAGVEPGSPITMVVSVTQAEGQARISDGISDITITADRYDTYCYIIDGLTLKAAGKPQPVSLSQILGGGVKSASEFVGTGEFFGPQEREKPVALPTSRNGCMVNFSRNFLVITPNAAVAYPFGKTNGIDLKQVYPGTPRGSLSGLMAFSNAGQAFKAGIEINKAPNPYNTLGSTPCGRYQFWGGEGPGAKNCLSVRLAETNRELFRVARLPFIETAGPSALGRLVMLGDEGPLAILSKSGKTLEIVDLNIPAAAKDIAPSKFHVISQPTPYAAEGQILNYQVQVNNPEAVAAFRLQGNVTGASLAPQGLLTYKAPDAITGATNVTIPIEIVGKDGQIVLHEFPIYIVPRPRPATGIPQPTPIRQAPNQRF